MKSPLPRQSTMKTCGYSFRQPLFIPLSFLLLFTLLLTACGNSPPSGKTVTPTPGTSLTPTPGKTVTLPPGKTATPTPAPMADQGFLLTQQNPICDHSPTTVWKGGPKSTAASSCRSGTFALSPVSQTQLAEIDLAKVNGKDYSSGLIGFEISADLTQAIAVSLGFQESRTDIWGGFNVQTPAPGYGCGGFIFEVSPLGHWNLEHVDSCDHITVIHTGIFSPPTPSSGRGDSPTVTMHVKVTVQNGIFTGWVEEKSIVSIPDPFVPSPTIPSVVGLVAQYRTNTSLSPTMFTNFRLATGICREATAHCAH